MSKGGKPGPMGPPPPGYWGHPQMGAYGALDFHRTAMRLTGTPDMPMGNPKPQRCEYCAGKVSSKDKEKGDCHRCGAPV